MRLIKRSYRKIARREKMKAIKELEKYKNSIIEAGRAGGYLPCLDDVNEALVELQDLESYVVGQIGSLSAKLESLSFSDKCIVEYQIKAYTDILQKIRGEKC